MTSINGVAVPANIFAYDIAWKIPGSNANNAAYEVAMVVYDSASSSFPPNGKCGKAQWSFVKGTVPPTGTTCGENSFIGTIQPPAGTTVKPNDVITVAYEDESVIYHPTPVYPSQSPDANHQIVFTLDGTDIPQAPLTTDSVQGPNTDPAYNSSTDHYQLHSPTTSSTSEKYSTDIKFRVPSNLSNGAHSFHLQAYDSDNNKPGGDCGIVDWSLNVTGGASNVELVQ
jgi:hypothetical protein